MRGCGPAWTTRDVYANEQFANWARHWRYCMWPIHCRGTRHEQGHRQNARLGSSWLDKDPTAPAAVRTNAQTPRLAVTSKSPVAAFLPRLSLRQQHELLPGIVTSNYYCSYRTAPRIQVFLKEARRAPESRSNNSPQKRSRNILHHNILPDPYSIYCHDVWLTTIVHSHEEKPYMYVCIHLRHLTGQANALAGADSPVGCTTKKWRFARASRRGAQSYVVGARQTRRPGGGPAPVSPDTGCL